MDHSKTGLKAYGKASYRLDPDGPTVEEPEDACGGGAHQEGGHGDGDGHLHGHAHQRAVRHVAGLFRFRVCRHLREEEVLGKGVRLAASDGPHPRQTLPPHRKQVDGAAYSHLLQGRLSENAQKEVLEKLRERGIHAH